MLAESQLKILSRCVAARLCTFFQDGSNAWHGGTPRDKIHPCPRIRPSVPLSLCGKGKLEKHPRFNLSQLHLSFTMFVGICGNYMMGATSMRKEDKLNL